MTNLAARIEGATSTLSDPDGIARELAAVQSDVARQLAAGEERIELANRERKTAESACRLAEQERDEATESAAGAWERTEELEAELARLQQLLDEETETSRVTAGAHEAELVSLRAEHETALSTAHDHRRRAEGAVTQLGAEIAQLREDYDERVRQLRIEHTEAIEAVRQVGESQTRTALVDQAANLAAVHASELTTAVADGRAALAEAEVRHQRDAAEAEGRAIGAGELAEGRREEIERLVAQVETLQAALGGGAGGKSGR